MTAETLLVHLAHVIKDSLNALPALQYLDAVYCLQYHQLEPEENLRVYVHLGAEQPVKSTKFLTCICESYHSLLPTQSGVFSSKEFQELNHSQHRFKHIIFHFHFLKIYVFKRSI